MRCRHCRCRPVCRPRGLCWRCFYTPAIRRLYPITSKFARGSILDFYGLPISAFTATNALPGTPEKIAVLAQRAELRQSLWHPDDATWERVRDTKRRAVGVENTRSAG